MNSKIFSQAFRAAAVLAATLYATTAIADAVCPFAGCPGAPLPAAGALPAPLSVPEGQNIFLGALVVPGDTVLLDADGSIGDVLRFFAGGCVFLYSDNPGTEPIDTGIPPLGANVFTMPEAAETPPFVAAKYVAGAPGLQNTYFVLSDTSLVPDIPEPQPFVLLGLGLAVLGLTRRRHAGA